MKDVLQTLQILKLLIVFFFPNYITAQKKKSSSFDFFLHNSIENVVLDGDFCFTKSSVTCVKITIKKTINKHEKHMKRERKKVQLQDGREM